MPTSVVFLYTSNEESNTSIWADKMSVWDIADHIAEKRKKTRVTLNDSLNFSS